MVIAVGIRVKLLLVLYIRVQRFSNLDDIYPSLATCWPIDILISVFKFFCDVLTAESPL